MDNFNLLWDRPIMSLISCAQGRVNGTRWSYRTSLTKLEVSPGKRKSQRDSVISYGTCQWHSINARQSEKSSWCNNRFRGGKIFWDTGRFILRVNLWRALFLIFRQSSFSLRSALKRSYISPRCRWLYCGIPIASVDLQLVAVWLRATLFER